MRFHLWPFRPVLQRHNLCVVILVNSMKSGHAAVEMNKTNRVIVGLAFLPFLRRMHYLQLS